MTIIIRRPWTRQPRASARVNSSGPIRSPSFLYSPISGIHRDWARDINSTVSGASVGVCFDGYRFNGGVTYPTFPHIAQLRGKSSLTLYLRLNSSIVPGGGGFTELFNNWDQGFYVVVRYNDIRLYLNGGTVAGGFSTTSGGPLQSADTDYDICLTVALDGTTNALVNGVLWPMTQFTALTIGSGSSDVKIGCDSSHRVDLAAVWPFALSSAESRLLMGSSRWQMFAGRRVIIPASAAGIVPPTLLTAYADQITTSSARPNVTFTRP